MPGYAQAVSGIWIPVFVVVMGVVTILHYKFSPALGEVAKVVALALPLAWELVLGLALAYRYAVERSWAGVVLLSVLAVVGPVTGTVVWRRVQAGRSRLGRVRHAVLLGLVVGAPVALVLTGWLPAA